MGGKDYVAPLAERTVRLVLITHGTEVDTRPLAVLARGLMDAGHDVWLLADGATLASAEALGVPNRTLAGDIRAAVSEGDSHPAAGRDGVARLTAAFARIANANTAEWMRQLLGAARGRDAILVSGLAAFTGLSVAEHLRVPAIGLGLIPITPTSAFPSPFLPPERLPAWLNRSSHQVVNFLVWRAFSRATNAARASICQLPPRLTVWSDHPMLYGVSPNLLPRPINWPANAQVCGQWALPPPDWTPPPELRAFLAQGRPPLYIGFGSMAGFDRQRLLDAVAGRRALLQGGWSGLCTEGLPPNFLAIAENPHAWLFPRTSVVIHHGGSGTTHSAARSGVPSAVVPFAGDQPFWGDRLRRAGVAAAPVGAKAINASALARGIAFAERPEVRARAATLGRRMAKENGVAAAIAAIEAIMSIRDRARA
jgi:UDP:flavonoid glycosyltransferase YjiC (YdhE family)